MQARDGVAVHGGFARKQSHAAVVERCGKFLECDGVDCREHASRRYSIAQQRVCEGRCDGSGMFTVAEAAFFRECVGIEPMQKICAVGTDDGALWEVQMGVDKARQNELSALIDLRPVGIIGGHVARLANPSDLSVIAHGHSTIGYRYLSRLAGKKGIIVPPQQKSMQDERVGNSSIHNNFRAPVLDDLVNSLPHRGSRPGWR